VSYTRQEIVDLLHRAGLHEVAEKAAEELPDQVELADAEKWGSRHGISRNVLISEMGGSP
jgi:hypothetical protein